MSHKVNLVRVLTAATGNSSPITLGAAYSQLFMTPAEAGAMNGRVYTYLIVDGNDWEMGKGVYTSSGTTLARTTILASRISGTLGTSKISLTGTAQVRFIESAEDMDGVRGTRAVTGTSDVIANSDQGAVITYSNASAIAVTLAQASSSNLFLDGWATTVQNLGVGTVTITAATSKINGVSTLSLAQNMGAFIWSDGTNYHAYFAPVTQPLLAANNLSEVGATTVGKAVLTAPDAATAQTAIGLSTVGKAVGTAADEISARKSIYAAPIDALAFSGMQINGAMEVSQENGNNSVTVSAAAKYIVDGMQVVTNGSMVVAGQQSAAPSDMPAINALKVAVTTAQASIGATNYCIVLVPIEGYRVSRLLFGTSFATPISIGFWICGPAGTYSGAVRNSAATRTYPFSFTIAVSNVSQFVTITIPGDTTGVWLTTNGIGLNLSLCLAVGSSLVGTAGAWVGANLLGATGSANGVSSTSNTFYISNLIVLPGIELPPANRANLIMRPYNSELMTCQRYYWKGLANGGFNQFTTGNAQYASWHIPFPVTMRAIPTTSSSGISVVGYTDAVFDSPTLDGARLIGRNSSSANSTSNVAIASNGYLAADARL